jgi:hypothetical protein
VKFVGQRCKQCLLPESRTNTNNQCQVISLPEKRYIHKSVHSSFTAEQVKQRRSFLSKQTQANNSRWSVSVEKLRGSQLVRKFVFYETEKIYCNLLKSQSLDLTPSWLNPANMRRQMPRISSFYSLIHTTCLKFFTFIMRHVSALYTTMFRLFMYNFLILQSYYLLPLFT